MRRRAKVRARMEMPACRSDRGVRSVLEEIKDYFSVTCWVQPPNDDGVWEVREEVYFLRRAPREPLVTLRGTYGRLLLHLPAHPGAAWVEPPDPQLWPHSPRALRGGDVTPLAFELLRFVQPMLRGLICVPVMCSRSTSFLLLGNAGNVQPQQEEWRAQALAGQAGPSSRVGVLAAQREHDYWERRPAATTAA